MHAYYHRTAPRVYTATTTAGSFIAVASKNSDGSWTVGTGRASNPVNRLENVTLEEAFHYIESVLAGEVVSK